MVRVAQDRIADLFGLAERESTAGSTTLPDRYVQLARKIGTRYNVRLLTEYREFYCRGCSAYWVEGRTVRTRLRGGRRVRTCLKCGRERRTPVRTKAGSGSLPERAPAAATEADGALVGEVPEEPEDDEGSEEA